MTDLDSTEFQSIQGSCQDILVRTFEVSEYKRPNTDTVSLHYPSVGQVLTELIEVSNCQKVKLLTKQ